MSESKYLSDELECTKKGFGLILSSLVMGQTGSGSERPVSMRG